MFILFKIVNNFQRDVRLSVKFQRKQVSPNYSLDYNLHERKTIDRSLKQKFLIMRLYLHIRTRIIRLIIVTIY